MNGCKNICYQQTVGRTIHVDLEVSSREGASESHWSRFCLHCIQILDYARRSITNKPLDQGFRGIGTRAVRSSDDNHRSVIPRRCSQIDCLIDLADNVACRRPTAHPINQSDNCLRAGLGIGTHPSAHCCWMEWRQSILLWGDYLWTPLRESDQPPPLPTLSGRPEYPAASRCREG